MSRELKTVSDNSTITYSYAKAPTDGFSFNNSGFIKIRINKKILTTFISNLIEVRIMFGWKE